MKNILTYMMILMASVSLMSCSMEYEEKYDSLALNSLEYKLLSDGGSLMITVYYSGAWTVSMLEEDVDWGYLTRDRGTGVEPFRFRYDASVGAQRTVTLKIECDNGDAAEIVLTQS